MNRRNCFMNVPLQKCSICRKKKGVCGATAGCAIRKCQKTYHFTCAAQDKNVITKRIVIKQTGETQQVLYRSVVLLFFAFIQGSTALYKKLPVCWD